MIVDKGERNNSNNENRSWHHITSLISCMPLSGTFNRHKSFAWQHKMYVCRFFSSAIDERSSFFALYVICKYIIFHWSSKEKSFKLICATCRPHQPLNHGESYELRRASEVKCCQLRELFNFNLHLHITTTKSRAFVKIFHMRFIFNYILLKNKNLFLSAH